VMVCILISFVICYSCYSFPFLWHMVTFVFILWRSAMHRRNCCGGMQKMQGTILI
jgi:hypothetical protein